MRTPVSLLLVLVGGCTFNAPPPASYRCSPEYPACPEGQTCVANVCVSKSADARTDLAGVDATSGDLRSDAKRDGARPDSSKDVIGDLPRGDLAKSDLKTDLPTADLPRADLKADLPKLDVKPCGNGLLDSGEECDGSTFPAGASCFSYKRNGGTLGCTNACTVDLSKCCLAAVPPVTTPPVARIVSPTVGNNSTTQPLCTPYKTITAALQGAPSGSVVWAMPGVYSAATNGELFPIVLPSTVSLLGDEATRGLGNSSSGGPTLVSGSGPTAAGPATFQTSNTAKLSGFRIVGPTTTGAAIYVLGQNTNISLNTLEGHGGVRADKSSGSNCPTILQNTINVSAQGVISDCATTQIQSNTFNGTASGVLHLAGSGAIHGNTFNGCQDFGLQIHAGAPPVTQNTFTGGAGAFSSAAIQIGTTAGTASANPRIRGTVFPALLTIYGVRIVGNAKPDLGTGSDPGNNKFGATRVELVTPSVTIDAIGNDWAAPSIATPTCSPPLPPGSGQVQVVGAGSALVYGTGGGQSCHNP